MVFFNDPKRHTMVKMIRGVPTLDLVLYCLVYGFHIYRFATLSQKDPAKRESLRWHSTLYGVEPHKALSILMPFPVDVDFAFASLTMFVGKLATTVMFWVGTLDKIYDHWPKLSKYLILIAMGIIIFFALLNMVNEFQGETTDIIFGVYGALMGLIIGLMIIPYLKLTNQRQIELVEEEEELRTLNESERKQSSQNQKGETSIAPTSVQEAG